MLMYIVKDIDEYHTCSHLYEYCNANTCKESAIANCKYHKNNIGR